MDREPFAVVRDGYLLVAGEPAGEAEAPFEIMGLKEIADRINAAHDKDVRDAVEECMERVIGAMLSEKLSGETWTESDEAYNRGIDDAIRAVRALPTERAGQ